ncbi:hypothetical protein ACLOJK_015987 [Asimina triloba]
MFCCSVANESSITSCLTYSDPEVFDALVEPDAQCTVGGPQLVSLAIFDWVVQPAERHSWCKLVGLKPSSATETMEAVTAVTADEERPKTIHPC